MSPPLELLHAIGYCQYNVRQLSCKAGVDEYFFFYRFIFFYSKQEKGKRERVDEFFFDK
jgi:hypothetical protein